MPAGLRERAVLAYGGEERWRAARTVTATVSVTGPMIRLKRGRGYPGLVAAADPRAPSITLGRFEEPETIAVLEGHDVRIEGADGRVLERRPGARAHFRDDAEPETPWDRLDMAYFLGYAVWNYLTLPALLLRDDIDWRELSATVLEARFPSELPTHCAVQQYHFDPDSHLLREYHYTADVLGPWAGVVHTVLEHAEQEGLTFPSARRVRPHGAGDRPPAIAIDVHDHRLG